jgi:hypothetical protein
MLVIQLLCLVWFAGQIDDAASPTHLLRNGDGSQFGHQRYIDRLGPGIRAGVCHAVRVERVPA